MGRYNAYAKVPQESVNECHRTKKIIFASNQKKCRCTMCPHKCSPTLCIAFNTSSHCVRPSCLLSSTNCGVLSTRRSSDMCAAFAACLPDTVASFNSYHFSSYSSFPFCVNSLLMLNNTTQCVVHPTPCTVPLMTGAVMQRLSLATSRCWSSRTIPMAQPMILVIFKLARWQPSNRNQ